MNRKKKILISISFIMLIIFSLLLVPIEGKNINHADRPIEIKINGKVVRPKQGKVYIDKNQRTMMPIRFVAEELGYELKWNQAKREVVIDDNVLLTIGDNRMFKDGRLILMDTEAVLNEGSTYAPVRFVAEALNADIEYKRSEIKHLIEIYSEGYEKPSNPADSNNLEENMNDWAATRPTKPEQGTMEKPYIETSNDGVFDNNTITLKEGSLPEEFVLPQYRITMSYQSGGGTFMITNANKIYTTAYNLDPNVEIYTKTRFVGDNSIYNNVKFKSPFDEFNIKHDVEKDITDASSLHYLILFKKDDTIYYYDINTGEKLDLYPEDEPLVYEFEIYGTFKGKPYKAVYEAVLNTPNFEYDLLN